MAGTIAPWVYSYFTDNNGDPLNAGTVTTYAAGTTTPLATYSDSALTTPNANPVVLDSAGRCTMYLSATSYKFVVKDSSGNTIRTADNISAIPLTNVELDIVGTAGEALTAGQVLYLSDGSGGATTGRWYKADADNSYSSTAASAIGFAVNDIDSAASGSIRIAGRVTGLSGLTAGTVYYISATAGALTATAPGNARSVVQADSTTTAVIIASSSMSDTDIIGTAGETLAAGESVYLADGGGGTTAGRWYKTDSDAASTSSEADTTGFAVGAITSGATGLIRRGGRITGLSSLTAGAPYYASSTAGGVTSTAPTLARRVGVADSTTSILVEATQPNNVTDATGYIRNPYSKQIVQTAGTGTGTGPIPLRVNVDTSTVGNGAGAETTLHTYTLPGNSLDADGDTVVYNSAGTIANNANAKVIKFEFGATSVTVFSDTGYANSVWQMDVFVTRTSATAQVIYIRLWREAGTIVNLTTTAAETMSGNIVIRCRGNGAGASDITQKFSLITVT